MTKPTPAEVEQLRALYPKGAPRLDYREMTLLVDRAAGAAAADANALIPVAISSEAPVLRYDWWEDERYYEVLDHSPSSVVLDYARDGLPFVASHRSWDADQQHGLAENIRVEKKVLKGDVRMSRATRSQEIAQDMRDGIRKKVSVGYIVGDQYTQTKGGADGIPIRRYTAWMPIEVSTVPIPADYAVGVGRAQSPSGQATIARFLELVPPTVERAVGPLATSDTKSEVPAVPVTPTPAAGRPKERTMPEENAAPAANATPAAAPAPVVQVTTDNSRDTRANEVLRIDNIRAMGTQAAVEPEKISKWIGSGASELEVVREINAILTARMAAPIKTVTGPVLTEKEQRRFSYARALLLNSDIQKDAGPNIDFGFEREMAQEVARTSPLMKGMGGMIPFTALRAGVDSSVATTGGPFKFTQPGEFIPLLRNKSSVMRAGATVLTGLTGPLTFPKQTTATTAVYSAENPGSDIAVSNLLTTTVTLAFKSLAAGTAFSRQMLFSAAGGNFDVEAIVQSDLNAVIGLAIDLGGLNGSGATNNPKGILKNTSIGSVTLGTNGGTMAWGSWVDLETKIAQANADSTRMSYITNAAQRGFAKKKAVLDNTASGQPIWTGTPGIMDGVVNGYRALSSEQVPANLTKGTSTTLCSAILFGAFEHLLIGMFGTGVETIVDPYSKKYQGMVEVSIWTYFDVQSRYDGAFAAAQDAL